LICHFTLIWWDSLRNQLLTVAAHAEVGSFCQNRSRLRLQQFWSERMLRDHYVGLFLYVKDGWIKLVSSAASNECPMNGALPSSA